jgi:hypothetical protein
MPWFTPFLVLLALAWAAVGILLAKWLKQAGHTRPFTRRELNGRELYGGGVGFGRTVGFEGVGREVLGAGPGGGRAVEMGGFGGGRVKGI